MDINKIAPNRRSQRVIVERVNDEFYVMLDDASIEVVTSPEQALDRIQRDAKKRNVDMTITTIEWRNMPADFVPPTKSRKS